MKQLFILPKTVGASLPAQPSQTWLDAFPDGAVLTLESSLRDTTIAPRVVWVRFAVGMDLTQLLLQTKAIAHVPFVLMSDIPNESEGGFALAHGAAGYCNSHASVEVLHQVAQVVEHGGLWVGQQLLDQMVKALAKLSSTPETPTAPALRPLLSEREWEVAMLVAKGESNKEIARHLDISERTVKAHLGAIFDKTKCRDRLQLSLKINRVLD